MSRLEHVLSVGTAIKEATPTPTAVFPMHQLPDDLLTQIFSADLQNVPIENLCAALYERCLLVRGSGSCPPDDPFWEEACRRLGLPQAGFNPMGDPASWQETFRSFCEELSETWPDVRRWVWLCLQGRAKEITQEDLDEVMEPMHLSQETIPDMVLAVLEQHGVDFEPDDYDDYAPGGWHYDRL